MRGRHCRRSTTIPTSSCSTWAFPIAMGWNWLPLIRKNSKATLLVVSARDATDQKVTALDLGADDYVTKPFDTEELLARIRAALRSRMSAGGAQLVVKAADLELDLVKRRVHKGAAEVHLTPKEYGVLAELARFPGRVITHDQLLKRRLGERI